VTSLGFEVRIELSLEDGAGTWVQLDRASAKAVDVKVGDQVFLSPGPDTPPTVEERHAASCVGEL
jgi:anthranilate/para-aminobenzoate synthase component II